MSSTAYSGPEAIPGSRVASSTRARNDVAKSVTDRGYTGSDAGSSRRVDVVVGPLVRLSPSPSVTSRSAHGLDECAHVEIVPPHCDLAVSHLKNAGAG